MIGSLTNHLWQSTVFAIAAGVLTLAFRKNRAKVRYWLWLSASLKFFVPFALLMSMGNHLQWTSGAHHVAAPAISYTMEQISEPFPAGLAAPASHGGVDWVPLALLGVWLCGFASMALVRLRDWLRIRAALRAGTPLDIAQPVEARLSPGLLEPGVVGLLRPILLLPEGIVERLTASQLETLLAHELCHVERRDNLTAALHIVVEAVFWFHPLVWWIGARLVEERELACDEEVMSLGCEPRDYADAILSVCKLYVESPLVCVPGVSGANLRRRIEAILTNRVGQGLTGAKKLLLARAGAAALAGPVAIGIGHVPAMRAQATAVAPQQQGTPLQFDAASIKPHSNALRGGRNGGTGGNPPIAVRGGGALRYTPGSVTSSPAGVTARKIILEAFHLTQYQLSGGPAWLDSDRFDLEAKDDGGNEGQLRQMLQSLLAERFQLVVHRDVKEMPVYALVVGKNGTKLREWKEGDPIPEFGSGGHANNFRDKGTMRHFADFLSNGPAAGRPVLDKTFLPGVYVIYVEWDEGEEFLPVMQEKLGLKLESQKARMDVFVIDSIQKPSEN